VNKTTPGGDRDYAIIRPAIARDLPGILALERQSALVAHWSENTYRESFESQSGERIILVAEIKNQIAAFLVARFIVDECELENIVVAAAHRRKGIASQLLEHVVGEARKAHTRQIFLEVRESNTPAIAAYGKFGFRRSGVRNSYYSDPAEHAVLFTLAVSGSP
jgi:[ribosomal protein S18]-alanine N-acetyltransferase